MLAAPTEKEDQVAVAPKETVDKATEKTAEARLEERMAATRGIWRECQNGGGLGRGYPVKRVERSTRGNREDRRERRSAGGQLFLRTHEKLVERLWGGRRRVVERILRRTGTGDPVTGGKESLRVFRSRNSVGSGVGHATGRRRMRDGLRRRKKVMTLARGKNAAARYALEVWRGAQQAGRWCRDPEGKGERVFVGGRIGVVVAVRRVWRP